MTVVISRGNLRGVYFIIFLALLSSGCLNLRDNTSTPTFLITESPKYISLDPLDGDQVINLPVQRMLYSSIIEISPEDDFQSFVLSSFDFDSSKKTLTLNLKENFQYSDGSFLESKDIVFSILRMLKRRPSYPVINKIEGVDNWSGNLNKLPTGITYSKNSVSIKFDEMNFNPISRFSLEIFSVIPASCIDPISGDLKCLKVPQSGPYKISSESEKEIVFLRNRYFPLPKNRLFPDRIKFKYIDLFSFLNSDQQLNESEVLYGNEIDLSVENISTLREKFNFIDHPIVRFKALEFLDTDIFQKKECRQRFAELFRKSAAKLGIEVQNSIFTKIMKGYKKFPALKAPPCKVSRPIRWGYYRDSGSKVELEAIMKDLKLNQNYFEITDPLIFSTYTEMADAVFGGELDIVTPSSGFWAADPASDLSMYFTPNMHRILDHITADPELQRLLKALEKDQSPENFEKVNRYLYEDAKFNVYRHAARFYMTNKNVQLKNLPLGITSPAPYTVLEKLSGN